MDFKGALLIRITAIPAITGSPANPVLVCWVGLRRFWRSPTRPLCALFLCVSKVWCCSC